MSEKEEEYEDIITYLNKMIEIEKNKNTVTKPEIDENGK